MGGMIKWKLEGNKGSGDDVALNKQRGFYEEERKIRKWLLTADIHFMNTLLYAP